MTTATTERGIETRYVVMRAYGNTYASWVRDSGPQPFISYARFAEGMFLAAPPRQKDAAMENYRDRMRQRVEQSAYRLPRTEVRLLDVSPEELRQAIINEIMKDKETKKLWTSANDIEGYMGHYVLSGYVPSRRSGSKSGVLSRWPVVIKSPVFDDRRGHGMNYSALACACEDYIEGTKKGVSILDVHMCAAIKRAWDEQANPDIPERQRRISNLEAEGPIYLPYNITLLDAMDVVFRKYVVGEDYKDIDRTELGREENYDHHFLDAIRNGRIVFEVVRQKAKKVVPKTRQEMERINAEKSMMRPYLSTQLRRAGFEKVGLYALEFKDTLYETVCETYVRGSEVVRPVFNENFPPLIVHWVLGDENDIFGGQGMANPFEIAGETFIDIEDRTRLIGRKRIIIPGSSTPMPEGMNPTYMHPLFRRDYMARIPSEKLRALGIALF